MNHPGLTEDDRKKQKMLHDLRGPAINASAFNKELTEAIERLCEILKNSSTGLNAEESVEINKVLLEDVIPCNGYVQAALAQMQERLDELAR